MDILVKENVLFSEVRKEGIVAHSNGLIIDVDPVLLKLLGYTSEQVLGKNVIDFVHFNDHGLALENIHKNRQTPYDVSVRCKNGVFKRMELIPQNICHNGVEYRIALMRDISDRYVSDLHQMEENRRLNTLIENLPGITFRCLLDENWTMVSVSHQIIELTGYTPQEFINNKVVCMAEIIHPEDCDYLVKEVSEAVEDGTKYQVEYRIKTKSGEEKWFWEQGCGVYEKDKCIAIEGFITDITRQKNAELNLLKYNENLEAEIQKKTEDLEVVNEELRQQSEEISTNLNYIEDVNKNLSNKNSLIELAFEKVKELNNSLKATNDALNEAAIVSVTDTKGNILEVNDKFCEVSEYLREELLGKNQNIVSSREHTKDFWSDMWQTIAKGEVWRGEIKNRKKGGDIYWVDTVIAPFFNTEGKPEKFIAIRFLITAKKESEKELQQKNRHITQSIEYAKNIQEKMLPEEKELKKHFEDTFFLYQPRDIVSGDFIWYTYDANSNTSFVSVVDCTGHGVPGAFMSVLGFELLEHIVVNRSIHRTDIVLEEMDKAIRKLLKQEEGTLIQDGMDMCIASINHTTNKMVFSGAHNGMVIIRDGNVMELKPDKYSIGSNFHGDDKEFTKQKVDLLQGDQLYFYSDGYPDQIGGPDQKKFMKKNFKECIVKHSLHSMDVQKQCFLDSFNSWKGDFFQLDDVTIVGLKVG